MNNFLNPDLVLTRKIDLMYNVTMSNGPCGNVVQSQCVALFLITLFELKLGLYSLH